MDIFKYLQSKFIRFHIDDGLYCDESHFHNYVSWYKLHESIIWTSSPQLNATNWWMIHSLNLRSNVIHVLIRIHPSLNSITSICFNHIHLLSTIKVKFLLHLLRQLWFNSKLNILFIIKLKLLLIWFIILSLI